MTLSQLEGHSYCKPFKCFFLYGCAAVFKISTDMLHSTSGVAKLFIEICKQTEGQTNRRTDGNTLHPCGDEVIYRNIISHLFEMLLHTCTEIHIYS